MAHKKNDEAWWTRYAADPRSTDELIRLAIDEWDMEYHERPYPNAMTVLHCKADNAVFEAALRLVSSSVPVEREVGAWLLGEFGHPDRVTPERCIKALMEMLATESNPDVLGTVCHAFSHHERTIEIIHAVSRFKNHLHEDVRFGVVMGLLWSRQDEAIATLIELSRDTDEDVRNWATFGIGQIIETAEEPERFDTPAVRQALFDRLDDPHWETRREALAGLTLRRDRRIVNRIVDMLVDDNPMMNSEFCEGLRDMLDLYTGSKERLNLALNRCTEDNE